MSQKKAIRRLSESASTAIQRRTNASIWTLNLASDSKIAQQYYCELHRKRTQAYLGSTDFKLPYTLTDEGVLCVKREDFKKLELLIRDRIVHEPVYVSQLVSSRQRKLEVLKHNLDDEYRLLKSDRLSECNPVQTFSYLTDFACLYLEYNFPASLYKELIVGKLQYSEEAYEHLRLRLLTPYESAYLTYYGALLRLAMQKLSNAAIDLQSFRRQFSAISDRDVKKRSDSELEAPIQRLVTSFKDRRSLHFELMQVIDIEQNIKEEHATIKKELVHKALIQGADVSNLVSRLSDMLIDAALENEQTSIWRGRTYAYLSYLIEALGLNPHAVSVEDIQSMIYRTPAHDRLNSKTTQ